jgi:hypothetical protein
MMTFSCRAVSLALFISCGGFAQDAAPRGAQGQPPKEKGDAAPAAIPELPATLDEMLAAALRSSPEILKSEAKLRKAQADLNQVRLQATQDVIAAYYERVKDIQSLALAEEQTAIAKRMVETGTAPMGTLTESKLAYTNAQARIAQCDAKLRYVMGLGGSSRVDDGDVRPVRSAPAAPRRPEFPDEIRALLEKKVTVSEKDVGSTLETLLVRLIGKQATLLGDTNFSLQADAGLDPGFQRLNEIPLRAALLAIADLKRCCFVFRDYGVLVTSPERAATMNAPCIPPETPLKLGGTLP